MTVKELLKDEYLKLDDSTSESEKSSILYNIIRLKTKSCQAENLYKDIKQFIDAYIETIKLGDYGYDSFNYHKIELIINLLPSNQQISILNYFTSVSSRELPEQDRNWFIARRHKAEIKQIIENRNYLIYPKIILLYLGQSLTRLLLGLVILFILTCIMLMPAPIKSMALFEITYENYSQNSFFNCLMNVLALYAGIENNVKVEPLNIFGLLAIILGKLFFVTIIVNFIYFKISDKISQR